MWAMRLNIVDWSYFKSQTLQEILKTQNQHQAEFCAFLEVEHLYRSVGCARSERQCLTAPQDQRSFRWMLVCVWTVCLRLTYAKALKCLERPIEHQNQPKHAQGKPVSRPKSHPRLNKCWIRIVNPSNIEQVLSNAYLSEKQSKLYIFEDNEAVIKMIIKGRSPTMSRTHRVALDWSRGRTDLDPRVQIKYVESKDQLADI